LDHSYDEIISLENLCLAWEEFVIGKKQKRDVCEFGFSVMDNILSLHESLINQTYCHGAYQSFYITDPKLRHIHKASVRDRLLHHAVYRILYPFFDRAFIADSFSCRNGKGTHKAINRFREFTAKASHNQTRTVWVLKCDIRKFFASIDHKILLEILHQSIPDLDIMRLLQNIVESFHDELHAGVGLPLGNLTSQLFSNVYMHRFDVWVKQTLKTKFYIRYADDFVLLSEDREWLQDSLSAVQEVLDKRFHLFLHPNRVTLQTVASGVDFLGWVHFSDHRVLRTKTKQRIIKKILASPSEESFQSYLGVLCHGNAARIRERLVREYWIGRDGDL
jgi:retron-type reverse transcriptase